jgi:hypothetical protein
MNIASVRTVLLVFGLALEPRAPRGAIRGNR